MNISHIICSHLPQNHMSSVLAGALLKVKYMQVAYIDTEGTFRAEKVRAIAARFDLDADAVLDNVSTTPFC